MVTPRRRPGLRWEWAGPGGYQGQWLLHRGGRPGAVSCWFWLPRLARDPGTQAWHWAGPPPSTQATPCEPSEVQSEAGCSGPGPGPGCKTHRAMKCLSQIHPAWAPGSSSKKPRDITTVIYSSLVADTFPVPSLSLLGISVLHVPPPPRSPS